jgi:S-adenosylmethionine decarboxylase proenzyme
MENYNFCGVHVLGEIYDVNRDKLNNLNFLVDALSHGIEKSKATCIGTLIKKFEPQGISVVMLLSESHVSIHTYPEHHSLFIDAFTCGEKCNPEIIIQTLKTELDSNFAKINVIKRGYVQ